MLQWISAVLRLPFDDDKHAEGEEMPQSLQYRLQAQHRHNSPLRQERGMIKASAQPRPEPISSIRNPSSTRNL